jgi:hypothetical protein
MSSILLLPVSHHILGLRSPLQKMLNTDGQQQQQRQETKGKSLPIHSLFQCPTTVL